MKKKNKNFIFMYALNRHVAVVLSALVLIAGIASCSFFSSISDGGGEESISITSLALGKSGLSMKVGSLDYVSVSVKPQDVQKDVKLIWSYDESVISCDTSSNWGVTIKGVAEGQTNLKCSYGGYDATCIVTVSGYEEGYETTTEPYIYSNTTILQTSPGVTEKVFVSLYGGDASDIDGYTWTADNSSVAQIQPTGQYCIITARETGYARIKITHTKAAYPYYMGVYVFDDATKVTYITTSSNILTMKQEDDETAVSVSLVNGKDTSLDSSFSWQIVGTDSAEVPVRMEYNGNRAVITPLRSGSCTLRVTHPDAAYPLDILCRVITVIRNVYIQPDNTILTLSGSTEQTVTCSLENLDDGEYGIDEYTYALDDYNVAEIISYVGNQVMVRGVANGSCKLLISHPKAAYTREVLLIVTGQLKDAVDASCYITTSQNYIRTKVGAPGTTISISLKGGSDGDESGFVWAVKSSAADGISDVIRLETANGSTLHSRAAAQSFAYGTAYIEPVAEGTAVITLTHPKVVYPTEILVKVLNKDAILEEQLYFAGSGLVRLLNGSETDYKVELKGKGKTASDDEETLASMRALYSDKLYYNFEVGETATCFVQAVGFDSDEEKYDYSALAWTVRDPSLVSVEKSEHNPLLCTVRGLKAGSTTLTATLDGVSCDFTMTVYPAGTVATEPEVYFTTAQNVVTLGGSGKDTRVYVSAINLSASEYLNITWSSGDTSVATVVPNGVNATVTAVADGETVISVTHPVSQNTLKIWVRVGSEYVIPESDPVVYIAAQDVLTLLKDDPPAKLQAVLVNYDGNNTNGFSFAIDNENVAMVSAQSANGIAYIKPVGSGQCEVTVSHTATGITKKVLVVVGNSAEELAGYVYLTTSSNVVAVGEGSTKSVSVSVRNAADVVLTGYSWTSSNPACVDITQSGATAVLKGNGIGTAIITVTNTQCQYPLQIIAQCVDPIAASANPYIQLSSSVMTLTVGNTYTSVSADLVGGTEGDLADFVWATNDSGIAVVYGQNEVGKIRAMSAGTTYITVRHPKAAYPAQLLVVCDNPTVNDCYISVPSSIISMKPTDSSQTITASLVNGSATDRYSFRWSLDVYDVVDFQYSANVCTIRPLQAGSVTITISHPKAAYDQQVIVSVQEYTTFAFPQDSMTVTQGGVQFITMQVPVTTVATRVEYSVDNAGICSVTGTKSVAQLTAVGTGTTTVRAKLVATSTGVEQASAEMMVYVKERATDAVYITSSSTITTVNKGKSQTLSATLTGTGVTNSDQYNLKWMTSDSDIVQVTGVSADGTVTGQQIYITALKSGEALITCTHEKAASALQFYVVVPGTADKVVTLNKSYITLVKGSSGTQLKATIENAEGNSDYTKLVWTCDGANGANIVRVMGGSQNDAGEVTGQTVTIYPLSVGEATVRAQLHEGGSVATCTVVVEAGKSLVFETNTRKVQPQHVKTVKYTVSPPDAVLTWTMAQEEDFFTFHDNGCDAEGNGSVDIVGEKEGNGTLACVTDDGAKGTISVRVAWNYEFTVSMARIAGSPEKEYPVAYHVSPADATIEIIRENGDEICDYSQPITDGDGNGTFTVLPKYAGSDKITVRAKNPNDGNKLIGEKQIAASFYYDRITVNAAVVSDKSHADNSKEAYWSEFNSDAQVITVGDGEDFSLRFSVANAKVNVKEIKAELTRNSESGKLSLVSGGNGIVTLKHSVDTKMPGYVITQGYRPTLNGSTSYPDGTPIMPGDFKSDIQHLVISHSSKANDDTGAYYLINTKTNSKVYGLVGPGEYDNTNVTFKCSLEGSMVQRWWWSREIEGGSNGTYGKVTSDYLGDSSYSWGRQRDPSLDGICYSVEDFQSKLWYYCPDFTAPYAKFHPGEIDLTNISAEYRDAIPDRTLVNEKDAANLRLTITHAGGTETLNFTVYVDTRNCACTLPRE